jgi:uncharacterized protein YjaZ
MPVNPAYRDFFKALDAIEGGADPWEAYRRHYLRWHRDLLEAYWRQCWGTDEERVREMVWEMRPQDYRALRESLAASDIETAAEQALKRCGRVVDLPEPQADLLVGRFSPDAFLLRVGEQWHIGVGLERFAHFSALPLLIAHEYGHYARRMLAPEPRTLGDRVIAEGISVAFAEAAYPERRLTRHLRMTTRRVHEIRELEPRLWAALAPWLAAEDVDAFAGVLYGARRWRGHPPRFGCCLGYWAVRRFAQARGESVVSRAVLAAASQGILDPYAGPPAGVG